MVDAREPSPVLVTLDASPEVARWRPLVHWFLAIPHYVVAYFLQLILGVLTFVAFFTVLFTKAIPESIFNFMVLAYRYQWRTWSYVMFLREPYPPFEFTPAHEDPGIDPARLSVEYPIELRRLMPLVKWFLAIPHYVVLMVLGIGGFFATIGAFFAVLFSGRWPERLRHYVIGVSRYSFRVQAYVGLLTDQYPPFALD